ncbi:hypothetical protein HMPREF0378_1647 [Eubacterium nodatum ATCC 33099]|nr:hypothetical protein HMPREF0378_1647 [Eubacterium nodatum ATCC 33099]
MWKPDSFVRKVNIRFTRKKGHPKMPKSVYRKVTRSYFTY